jgi:dTDP-glucose pyrophosphorylase
LAHLLAKLKTLSSMTKDNIISQNLTIISALKLMDEIKRKLLIIVEEDNKFKGVLSLGDIQRAIINQKSFETPINEIFREIITVANQNQSFEEIKSIMIEQRVEAMPVIDNSGYLTTVYYWEDIIDEKQKKITEINLPVIIMAGGEGTRLRPLTNVIPKPLVPIGEKTMIETIIDNFFKFNCSQYYISVNYKSALIKYYLDQHVTKNIELNYFQEDKPLGTAGSLTLLKGKINETFFVSNCDILVEDDYYEILKYHRENKNELTVVAAVKNFSIPYGTIETGEEGLLKSITEKPDINYLINSGMYILEPGLIDEIPENTFYHITSLILKLKSENRRVGVFPVSDKSWIDIGEWKEYFKYLNIHQ